MSNNVQDLFLNQCRREKVKVTIFLANGVPMMGKIIHYDAYSIVIEVEKGGYQAFIYKHAILSIVPVFAVGITARQKCNVELHSNDLLSHCLMKKIPVELYLINGKKMTGTISHYDKYSLVLNSPDRKQNFIFKHGVSTILPSEKVILTTAKPI
ncbi:RNA chaperone Hfq [Paenibacillus xylanilyticus]|uniref:RNA-binding protein Hfq n=1 Tax=Paenibacillus xylanilyticus TaxID=248903 RepID=A0A7Y6BU53_9BACL|nr:RNA chaperone Hfq [Paenibacillus xylanilyticus]NUU74628.1 RNA chaperone Hfq [Paenibacillus xylanilyticus]